MNAENCSEVLNLNVFGILSSSCKDMHDMGCDKSYFMHRDTQSMHHGAVHG